jgi:transcriptional regulator with XRE-family HTH domain
MHYDVHLREIREACNLTMAEVCDSLQISEGHLSMLERKKRVLRVSMLPRLAQVYNCHPFDFLTFYHCPPPRILSMSVCAVCGGTLSAEDRS